MSEKPTDIKLLESPFRHVYVAELHWLASIIVQNCAAIFAETTPPDDGYYIKVDPGLHARISTVLINAAMVRNLVSPPQEKRKSESSDTYQVRQQRTAYLRDVLAGVQLSEMLRAEVRNSLEHFDERVDKAVAQLHHGTLEPVGGRALYNMSLSSWDLLDTVSTLGSRSTNFPVRLYVADERRFYNFGHSIELGAIYEEARAVVAAVQRYENPSDDPKLREPGGLLLSLASTETPEPGNKMDTLVVPPESPCGCGSGRPFGECHLKNGGLEVQPKDITPRGPVTREGRKKCLFAYTNNCGGRISGEHILSAAVLRRISPDGKITISGPRGSRRVPILSSSLTVNRLCQRHNSALSPLDAEAGRFIRAIQMAERNFTEADVLAENFYFFHAFDLERWFLKTLLAVYHARLTDVQPGRDSLPDGIMESFQVPLRRPFGLYMPHTTSAGGRHEMTAAPSASVRLIAADNLVVGIAVALSGLELTLIIDGHPSAMGEYLGERYAYRPQFLNYLRGEQVVSIAMLGLPGTPGAYWFEAQPDEPMPTT